MEREKIRAQVIEDLKSYPELKKKVVLLRYELDHPAKISDGEVIDSLALSRPVHQAFSARRSMTPRLTGTPTGTWAS